MIIDGITNADGSIVDGIIEAADFSPAALEATSTEAGHVSTWTTDSLPTGFLECDGTGLDTTTYATLFAAIGYTHGGSGATFNLPDYRGEFLRGFDNGAGIDTGRAIGSSQNGQYGSHNHLGGTKVYTAENEAYGGVGTNSGGVSSWVASSFSREQHYTSSTGGTENSSETRPRNKAVKYVIKY